MLWHGVPHPMQLPRPPIVKDVIDHTWPGGEFVGLPSRRYYSNGSFSKQSPSKNSSLAFAYYSSMLAHIKNLLASVNDTYLTHNVQVSFVRTLRTTFSCNFSLAQTRKDYASSAYILRYLMPLHDLSKDVMWLTGVNSIGIRKLSVSAGGLQLY